MASGVDPSIQGVGGASPHYKRGAGEVEHDEKKVASAEVSPSIQGVTAGTGWHGKLRSLFSVGPRPNRPHDSVYQPRAPLPAESASVWSKIWTFFRFLGPGAVISVAYVDPDNYQTAIASGSEFQYKLLFMVLVSNVIAIYVQVRRNRQIYPEENVKANLVVSIVSHYVSRWAPSPASTWPK